MTNYAERINGSSRLCLICVNQFSGLSHVTWKKRTNLGDLQCSTQYHMGPEIARKVTTLAVLHFSHIKTNVMQ